MNKINVHFSAYGVDFLIEDLREGGEGAEKVHGRDARRTKLGPRQPALLAAPIS